MLEQKVDTRRTCTFTGYRIAGGFGVEECVALHHGFGALRGLCVVCEVVDSVLVFRVEEHVWLEQVLA